MNSAVIVAAGSGSRFGADKPKQFLEIVGKPLIVHTLARFESCSAIDEIILVLPAEAIRNFSPILAGYAFKKLNAVVSGGTTRAASVASGLQSVGENCEIVAVHDGARPLVTVEEITETIESAKQTGAACLVAPLTDTIKQIKNGKINGTIDRNSLRRALTPQCFRLEILREAFQNSDLHESITDECFLVEKMGYEIAAIEGSAKNIKITTPEDWFLAEKFLLDAED